MVIYHIGSSVNIKLPQNQILVLPLEECTKGHVKLKLYFFFNLESIKCYY